MTRPVPIGLPWYHRSDYTTVLGLFSYPVNLPDTFDAWLKHAERVEKQLQAAGFGVARILISPALFKAWCEAQGLAPDQRARLNYANELARARHTPRRPWGG